MPDKTQSANHIYFLSKQRCAVYYPALDLRVEAWHMVTLSSTKEARIYNGKKIASLTSGAGKIGQPLVKE